MEFLPKPWAEITLALRKAKKRAAVTPYLNGDAFNMLPLRTSADVLVLDASERNVRGGLTNPHEIEKFMKTRVRCYTVEHLHSKVYRADLNLYVGSVNASTHSRDTLIEACLRVRHSGVVQQFENWLAALPLVPLLPDRIEELKKIYNPPKWPKAPGAHRRQAAAWVASITYTDKSAESKEYRKEVARKNETDADDIFTLAMGRRNRIGRDARPGDEFFVIDHREIEVVAYKPMRLIDRPRLIGNRYRFALEDSGEKTASRAAFVRAARKVYPRFPKSAKSTRGVDSATAAELRKLWR